jgi:hypothetical protein
MHFLCNVLSDVSAYLMYLASKPQKAFSNELTAAYSLGSGGEY